MNRTDISNRQTRILQEVAEVLKKEDDVVEFMKADDENPLERVAVEHEDLGVANDTVLGQYYYLPGLTDESDIEKFEINILLDDEIDEDKKAIMLQAVAYVNCLLPTGAFFMDPGLDSVSFHRGVNLMTDMEEKSELSMILFEIEEALQTVAMFVAPLLALMYGDIDWDEFIQSCTVAVTEGME